MAGAQAFTRFTDQDLRGFPISAADLQPCYEEVTRKIGISGANDDLTPFFGEDKDLLPPLRLSELFEDLYAGYLRSKSAFEQQRVAIGRPRLAVKDYRYDNLEFFQTRNPAIYTPAYTIDELRASGAITYLDGRLVMRYAEQSDCVMVHARKLDDGSEETYCGRKLCLGAGAINTARIVLASAGDFQSRLPLLDNPMACIPFFSPGEGLARRFRFTIRRSRSSTLWSRIRKRRKRCRRHFTARPALCDRTSCSRCLCRFTRISRWSSMRLRRWA